MPEETPELPISPQEVQIQAPSLLDKIKIHKFKILGGVLGVLVFVGAVFGAYKLGQRQIQPTLGPTPTPVVVATPTPDPTANWKTYTNAKYGYSIKFPDTYEVPPQTAREISQLGLDTSVCVNRKVDKVCVIPINILANNEGLSLQDWVNKRYPGQITKTTLNTYGAFLRKDDIGEYYLLVHNTNIIEIYKPTGQEENQILSTFKFLEESAYKCVEESSLNCAEEKELSFQCTEEYQNWARENCPGWEKYVYCEEPRPEVCTMECIQNPPYICGSDGKSYCNVCGACADPTVEWYIIQDTPCKP